MSHSVWPRLICSILLSGFLTVPVSAQDSSQNSPAPAPAEPWLQHDWSQWGEPASPAPGIEIQETQEIQVVQESKSQSKPEKPVAGKARATPPDPGDVALPQAEPRILASLSPASTWLWVHFKDWKSVLNADADQQASQALRELARRDGALVGRIKDFMEGLAGFANSHGFKPEAFLGTVAEEAEISFFETNGKPDFLLFLSIGGQEEQISQILTSFWKPWKTEAQSPAGAQPNHVWFAQSPYPYTQQIFASLEGVHLIFAGSPESMDLGRGLAKEKGAALAFDKEFQGLFGDARGTDESGWLQIFARPRKAARWIFGEDEKHKASPGFLSSLPVIGFESRFEKGTFQDQILLGRGVSDTGLYRILGEDHLDKDFAQKLAKALPDSIRAHLSWRGLRDELRDNQALALRLSDLIDLKEKLANTGDGKQLGETLDLLTGDMAWLPGDGDKEVQAFLFEMKDAFQCKSLLEKLGTAIQAPEGLGQSAGYALSLANSTWYAYMDEDLLCLSTDQERSRTLSRAMATQTSTEAMSKDWQPGLIEGRINSLAWLRDKDPNGNLGLLALAEWFDNPSLVLRKKKASFQADTEAITGLLPFALVSIDHILGRLDLKQAEWNKDLALQLGRGMHEAQKTYMVLVERDQDSDGKGEAGTLTDLIAARRVPESRQYRPWGMDVYERSGYRFRMMLPSSIDDRETKFFLLAWPKRATTKRPTCILLDADGQTYTNELTTELDLESGPEASQIFAGMPFDSSLAAGWRLHSAETETTTANHKPREAPTAGPVTDLDLEAALTLLDKAWNTKDSDRVRAFLDYENPEIRARAAHYLGEFRDKKSVPALAGLLKEARHRGLRRSAARALSLIRDPRSTATLLEALTDPDARVRLHAATALIANPVPGSLDALLALVDSYTEDEVGDRSQAMLAIHDLDQPDCLEKLVAVKAGGSRFQQALVYTFQELSPKLEETAEARILIAALSNPNKLLRKYAIQRLGQAQYKEAVSALKARLGKEGDELQPVLLSTLALLSPSQGTDKLRENFLVLKAKGEKLWFENKARFDALPEPHRYAIMGGGGLFLLSLFYLIVRRRRRKKAARRDQVLELLEHSDEFQAQYESEGDSEGEGEYGNQPYEDGYAEDGYAEDGYAEDGYEESLEEHLEGHLEESLEASLNESLPENEEIDEEERLYH